MTKSIVKGLNKKILKQLDDIKNSRIFEITISTEACNKSVRERLVKKLTEFIEETDWENE